MVRSVGVSARPLAARTPGRRCATSPGGPLARLLERELIATGRVVEFHALRVERVGVESTTEPYGSGTDSTHGGLMALGLKQAGTQLFTQNTHVPFAQYCVVIPRDCVHLQATANPFAPTVERVSDRLRAFGWFIRCLSGAEEDRLAGIGLREVAVCRLSV